MDVYVFGYGSLTSRLSTERTLGRVLAHGDGPVGAVLRGYRPEWVVGSNRESHPEREFRRGDGSRFDGCVAVLGLVEAAGTRTLGAVVRVRDEDLPPLVRRERNYALTDVTELVGWPGRPAVCRVHTFLPRPEALERLRRAGERAVRRGYLDTVREGFEALGDEGLRAYRELERRARDAHPIEDLTVS